MAKEFNTILHKRSVLSGTTENSPKLPEADILQYGELAVNYGAGHEAISFKNNNDEVVCVRTDEYYQEKFTDVISDVEAVNSSINLINELIDENEEVTAAALTDLDERLIALNDKVDAINGSDSPFLTEEEATTLVNSIVSDLDSTIEDTDGVHVKISVSQVDGRLSTVTVTESDIASASALTQEISARQSGETAIRGEITSAITAATTEISQQIETLDGKITILNGDETTNGSVKKTVVDEIAKVVAEAPEDFDTLKEIADWIANDQTGAAALANRVSALETADTEMLEAMETADEALDNKITVINTKLGTGFTEYENFTDVILDNEEVVSAALTEIDNRLNSLDEKIENAGVDEEAVNTLINNKLSDLDSTAEDVDGVHVKISVSQVDGRLSTVTVTESDIASASALTQEISARQSGETAIRGEITSAITAATTPIIGRVEAVETGLNTLNGDEKIEGSVKKTVVDEIAKVINGAPENLDTLKEIADFIANDQEGAASLVNRISALENEDTIIRTEIETADEALQNSIDAINAKLGSGFTEYESFTAVIEDNEEIVATALTDLDERVINLESMIENAGVDEEAVNTLIDGKLADLDSTVEDNANSHVKISISQVDGRLSTVTINESDVASASALTQEINARTSGETAIRNEITSAITAVTTEFNEEIEALDGKITILNGDEKTNGSVKKTVVDEIAKVVAEAPQDFDTLKEIADWIANDQTGAAALSNRVSALETADTEMLEAMETADEALDNKITAVDAKLGNGFKDYETFTDVVLDNELVTASVLVSLDERVKAIETPEKPYFNEDNLNYALNGNNFPVSKDDENNLYVAVEIPLNHLEQLSNKSNVIDENSTDDQYPTSKAVYDQFYEFEEGTAAALTNLNNRVTTIETEGSYKFEFASFGDDYAVKIDEDKNLYVTVPDEHLEQLSNKVTVIDENSTDNQYPTAKCVYKIITENELVTSGALTDLDNRLSVVEQNGGGNAGGGVDEDAVNQLINTKLGDLDSTASGSTAHITVTVNQADGIVNSVSVVESDIASASALTQEINARTSGETAIRTDLTSALTTTANSITSAYTQADEAISQNLTTTANTLSQSITDVNSLIGTGFTATNNVTKITIDNEKVTASALNELYEMIKSYEARITELENKLAAITIEEE